MRLHPLEKFLVGLVVLLGTPIILFLTYTILIWTPVALKAEAACLAQGFPKTQVSVWLEPYCMNLDGSVTVKVEKLK